MLKENKKVVWNSQFGSHILLLVQYDSSSSPGSGLFPLSHDYFS